jgi:hypothetical protein
LPLPFPSALSISAKSRRIAFAFFGGLEAL